MYSRLLDFDFGGCLTQRRLDLSVFSLNPDLWVTENRRRLVYASSVFDVDSGMLSNKLNRKKSLPYTYESCKRLYLLRYSFRGGLDMRISNSDVSPVLIFNNNTRYGQLYKSLLLINQVKVVKDR